MLTRVKHCQRYSAALASASAIGAFVPDLTKQAFQKYGFSRAAIVTDWPSIAGRDLAAVTRPERLKWPRTGHDSGDYEGRRQERCGASLVLRVEPSQALDVQYQLVAIKERINAYFGYCAVVDIRLLQAPICDGTLHSQKNASRVSKNDAAPYEAINEQTSQSGDTLLHALACLQHHIAANRPDAATHFKTY